MTSPPIHRPVMLDRVRELLAPALSVPGAVLVDATVGLGGHAEALLRDHRGLRLIGLDRDPSALELAAERLAAYVERVRLVASVFDQLPQVLVQAGVTEVDGVLFDLGASSFQLDVASRGFSYAVDAPLDMRMDPALPRTAADVLNDYSVEELTSLFRTYGEERFARRIAQLVVRSRAKAPFTTSRQLVELIYAAVPAPARRSGGHPAKRVFQALRIEVNAELDALRDALPAALQALRVEGRLVVLAYHSLEDRMVKSFLVSRARSATPPGLPVELPSAAPTVRLLTRGAERPSAAEVTANPRAASARLRAAEKLRYAA